MHGNGSQLVGEQTGLRMKERLANVVHWLSILLACGWSVLIWNVAPQPLSTQAWWAMVGGAAVLWAIGWIINYVLTGRTTMIPD
jgi:hypothetical protein